MAAITICSDFGALEKVRSTAKLDRRYRDFPYTTCLHSRHSCTVSPAISVPTKIVHFTDMILINMISLYKSQGGQFFLAFPQFLPTTPSPQTVLTALLPSPFSASFSHPWFLIRDWSHSLGLHPSIFPQVTKQELKNQHPCLYFQSIPYQIYIVKDKTMLSSKFQNDSCSRLLSSGDHTVNQETLSSRYGIQIKDFIVCYLTVI